MLTNEIKLIIHEEAELFSSLDPEQKMLSSDVVDYFDRTILNEHRKFREKYVIRIYSDSPVNEKSVEAKISAYYTQQKDDIDFAVKRLRLKEICIGIIGVILIAVWLFLSAKSNSVNVEILSIMGWVAIWEATSIAMMQSPELHRLQRCCNQLIQAEIVFETQR